MIQQCYMDGWFLQILRTRWCGIRAGRSPSSSSDLDYFAFPLMHAHCFKKLYAQTREYPEAWTLQHDGFSDPWPPTSTCRRHCSSDPPALQTSGEGALSFCNQIEHQAFSPSSPNQGKPLQTLVVLTFFSSYTCYSFQSNTCALDYSNYQM